MRQGRGERERRRLTRTCGSSRRRRVHAVHVGAAWARLHLPCPWPLASIPALAATHADPVL